jgi:hypothetical protein
MQTTLNPWYFFRFKKKNQYFFWKNRFSMLFTSNTKRKRKTSSYQSFGFGAVEGRHASRCGFGPVLHASALTKQSGRF